MQRWWTVLFSLAALFAAVVVSAGPEQKRPNVLLIAVDDLNDWVGYLGVNPQTITPNLDRLAARGTRFTRAYATAPLCNPSRAALITGRAPTSTGVYANNNDWRTVIPADRSLPGAFRKAGYRVMGAGKISHDPYERPTDWDEFAPRGVARSGGAAGENRRRPDGDQGLGSLRFAATDERDEDTHDWRVVEYGLQQLQRTQDKPFLLAVGLQKPHLPWILPRKYFDMHPLSAIKLPPTKPNDLADLPAAALKLAHGQGDHADIVKSGKWKEAVQAYLAAISYSDAMIGRLIEGLDRSPYAKDTIVVLWSDHGWSLGEKEHWHKGGLWERETHVPFVVVAPGVTSPNTVCERTVDSLAVFPTLAELCGLPVPTGLDGHSLVPLLRTPSASWARPAITTWRRGNHAVRTESRRYIRYADGSEELYDERADPHEWTNLAADRKYKAEKAVLARFLPAREAQDIGGVEPERGKD